jgi:hypothetical protein
VNSAPEASDVDAEPIVCARLASRIETREPNRRGRATVITATGIEVAIVSPTRRPR